MNNNKLSIYGELVQLNPLTSYEWQDKTYDSQTAIIKFSVREGFDEHIEVTLGNKVNPNELVKGAAMEFQIAVGGRLYADKKTGGNRVFPKNYLIGAYFANKQSKPKEEIIKPPVMPEVGFEDVPF